MAKIPGEDIHGVFARTLLHSYGIPKSHLRRVIEELEKIYDSMSFAHNHIMMSVMGYQRSGRTRALETFLEAHKTKEPKHRKEERERRERAEREHAPRSSHRELYYG